MIPGHFCQITSCAAFLAVMALKTPNVFSCLEFEAFSMKSVGATNSQSLTSDTVGLYLSFPLLRQPSKVSGMALKLENLNL